MNSNAKVRIGQALTEAMLPFHEVNGAILESVWETCIDVDLEAIHLGFDGRFLDISIDSSDDTIDVRLSAGPGPEAVEVTTLRPWHSRIGKPFGWGWLGVNQQGYTDSVSISFGSVAPQLCITAVASALQITRNFKVTARKPMSRKKAKRSTLAPFPLSA